MESSDDCTTKNGRVNYLAHMVVGQWAGLDEFGVLGNFIGDAVKGRKVEETWGDSVGRGIRLHRAIDDVSDRHASSREARRVLRSSCGKWSGVVWDVLADHVLASEFDALAHGCGGLAPFAKRHEELLDTKRDAMPERSRRFFDAMVSHGWLQGYRDPATVESVLVAMSTRRETSGPVALGWDAFVREEGLLRELGRDLVHHMELWGKEANHVSLGQTHLI